MLTLTRDLIRAAGTDAGNRSMCAAGRTVWSSEDYDAATREFNRLDPSGDTMLTIPQAARRLGLSESRIHNLVREGRLPATKPGRDWLIREEDLDSFAAIPRKPGHPGHRKVTP